MAFSPRRRSAASCPTATRKAAAAMLLCFAGWGPGGSTASAASAAAAPFHPSSGRMTAAFAPPRPPAAEYSLATLRHTRTLPAAELRPSPSLGMSSSSSSSRDSDQSGGPVGFFSELTKNFSDAAREGFGTKARNVAATMDVDDVVVPLVSNLERRQELANRGIYAGVEYVVCSIDREGAAVEGEGSEDEGNGGVSVGRAATIKPAYPLRPHLERADWPVPVDAVNDVPLWLNRNVYEAGTALGTVALALATILTASTLAFFVRFAYVPSESMLPAISPGDVVLVSRSANGVGMLRPRGGDVVFFDPPSELDVAIKNSKVGQAGGAVPTKGKQFLKRVVGGPADEVGVKDSEPFVVVATAPPSSSSSSSDGDGNNNFAGKEKSGAVRVDVVGPYSHPEIFPPQSWNRPPALLSRNEYFVAGDNGPRSVDSRVWGPLKDKYVFGTAKMIVWPPEHFGLIRGGNFVEVSGENFRGEGAGLGSD